MSDGGDSEQGKGGAPRGPRCPICAETSVQRYRPFCSKRCADIDLARWMSGRYVIAGGRQGEDEDGDAPAAPQTGSEAPRADD